MNNEWLLIINLIIVYFFVVVWFKFFKKNGLFCWTVIATIASNIEVVILIDAFGMKQTLGNVLFASTFLVTDILSEIYGKQEAKKAVRIGILTSISFILISKMWISYIPNSEDFMFASFKNIFSSTPRIMISGLIVYVIVQYFDVFMYHKLWKYTEKVSGKKKSFLWFRNSVSTLLSQLVNTVLFTIFAFYGKFNLGILVNIIWSSYIIFIFTSFSSMPILYLVRYLYNKNIKSIEVN